MVSESSDFCNLNRVAVAGIKRQWTGCGFGQASSSQSNRSRNARNRSEELGRPCLTTLWLHELKIRVSAGLLKLLEEANGSYKYLSLIPTSHRATAIFHRAK